MTSLLYMLPCQCSLQIAFVSQNQNLKALVELLAFQNLRKGKLLVTMRWWFICVREKLAWGY